jgi:drug/metabolite transporter (DMT)-like permease
MPQQTTGNVLRAAMWMSGAILSLSVMAVAGRAAAFDLDTFEIMLYRSILGLVIVLVVAGALGRLTEIRATKLGLHAVRNLAHFTGQNLWFYAITVIPLAQVFALEFSSPLWVLLLSPLILGERLTALRALAGAIGFLGVLIVARPSPETLNPGVISAALSAIGFALSVILTKRLTRTETITGILFWLVAMQGVMGLIAAGWDGDIAWPGQRSALPLVLIGVGGLVAHLCLTIALSIAPATVVVPIDFVRLPAIAIIGALFYNEAIDIWVFFGAVVIFGANYFNIWLETRRVTV